MTPSRGGRDGASAPCAEHARACWRERVRAVDDRLEVCIADGMQLDVEEIDLEKLAEVVKRRSEGPLFGAITGRSIVRDIVAAHLGCSLLEAEQLVDTMVARGFARLERDDEGRQLWRMTKGA